MPTFNVKFAKPYSPHVRILALGHHLASHTHVRLCVVVLPRGASSHVRPLGAQVGRPAHHQCIYIYTNILGDEKNAMRARRLDFRPLVAVVLARLTAVPPVAILPQLTGGPTG